MIGILLTILKIMSIILLILLAVVLVLVVLVLFAPIRYTVTGLAENKKSLKATAYWLLHLVHFSFVFDESGTQGKLRIFGVPVYRLGIIDDEGSLDEAGKKRSKKTEKRIRKAQKKWEKEAQKNKGKELQKNDKEETEKVFYFEENDIETKETDKEIHKKFSEDIDEVSVDSLESGENKKQSIFGRIRSFWGKVKSFFRKILDLVLKLKDIPKFIKSIIKKIKSVLFRIKKGKDKISEINKIIKSETFKQAFALCKNELIKLLKHIFPKRIKGYVQFGFEQPDVTGKVYGIICTIKGYTGWEFKKFKVQPEFEQQIFKGKIKARGRVRVFNVLIAFLKLYFNRNLRIIREKLIKGKPIKEN